MKKRKKINLGITLFFIGNDSLEFCIERRSTTLVKLIVFSKAENIREV